MANYTKMTVGKENRTELHEKLALTGAEISLNTHGVYFGGGWGTRTLDLCDVNAAL